MFTSVESMVSISLLNSSLSASFQDCWWSLMTLQKRSVNLVFIPLHGVVDSGGSLLQLTLTSRVFVSCILSFRAFVDELRHLDLLSGWEASV